MIEMEPKRSNNKESNKTGIYLWALLLFFGMQASAQNPFTLAHENQFESLLKNTSFFIDQTGTQSPDSLIWGKASRLFRPFSSQTDLPKKGKGSVWLRFVVNNISDHDIESFVFWGYSSKIDVHIANVSKITRVIHTGYLRESPERGYTTRIASGNLVLFRLNPSETIVLVRYEIIKNLSLAIFMAPRDQLLKDRAGRNLLMGLFLGILLVMMIYHLLIYFSLKDKAYLYYIVYMLAVALTFLRAKEYLNDILPSDLGFWFFALMIVTDNSLSLCYYLFTRSFLNLKKVLPRWDRNLRWMIFIRLSIMISLLLYYFATENVGISIMATNLTLLLELIFFCFSFQPIYKKGDVLAKFFVVGTACFFFMGISAIFFLTQYPMGSIGTLLVQIGVVLQILVFALGFGRKMKLDEDERQSAQLRLIDQLKENEQLQTKVNRELEGKVKERTQEIMLQKEEIETQRDDLEHSNLIIKKKNTQITDSMVYAKRIQSAFLPQENELRNYFPDYFVIAEAREIVSGDFYWMKESKDRFMLAVADSTGHGVPGALMSMLGNTAMNEVFEQETNQMPAQMLDRMRIVVKNALRQTGGNTETKDGFDVVLCSFDLINKTLEFAGANRSLLIIRNNELIEIKGDRQPIGIYVHEKPFTNQHVRMQSGDAVYLLTDGYSSQFGGPKGETFKTKRLKELLISISQEPMPEQKNKLIEQLSDWKGDLEQVDDITVIGLRI